MVQVQLCHPHARGFVAALPAGHRGPPIKCLASRFPVHTKHLGGSPQSLALWPAPPQRLHNWLLSGPLQVQDLCPPSKHLKQTSGCWSMLRGHTDQPTLSLAVFRARVASADASRKVATWGPAGPFRRRITSVVTSTPHFSLRACAILHLSVISSRVFELEIHL